MRVARAELTVHAGREPEPSELADFLGMELEEVECARAVPAEPTSLNSPVGTGDGARGRGKVTVVDLVAERAGETPAPGELAGVPDPRARESTRHLSESRTSGCGSSSYGATV